MILAGKKCYLIVTGAHPNAIFMDGVKAWFKTTLHYLGWENAGSVFAHGISTVESLYGSKYEQRAFDMGKSI